MELAQALTAFQLTNPRPLAQTATSTLWTVTTAKTAKPPS
jgi:hypothetical protein